MTPEELSTKIEAQAETQNLDFKDDCPWNPKTFIKDILAMSNVRDGGYIVIGIEDQSYMRKGVSPANADSYLIDVMKDQVASYADPHVDFLVSKVLLDGLLYVVVRVLPFRQIPVICRKNDQNIGLKEATLYYRNTNKRVESAAVSNSNDMRDILERATVKMMQNKTELGFKVSRSDEKTLEDELKGL